MISPFSLEGKTILVTGASSGIGRGIAVECSKMGAKIIITGRNAERLDESYNMLHGGDHVILRLDLSSQESILDLVKLLPELDGLVNCAGMPQLIPVTHINKKNFTEIMNVNAIGPIVLTTALLRNKKIRKGASVVFIESIAGIHVAEVGGASYAASKGTLCGFIKGAAVDLGAKQIRVNGVCPGLVKTNILNMASEMFSSEEIDENLRKYPLKRFGTSEDVAYGVIYLLSDASKWVTGINLTIDGGYTAL